jgi:hypothetical protein
VIVVRYVTLAALVLWLTATVQARFGDLLRQTPGFAIGCGAVIVVGLFAMKFMGPPPPAFVPRVAIVFAMLAVAVSPPWFGSTAPSSLLVTVDIVLGFVLLFWYTRE